MQAGADRSLMLENLEAHKLATPAVYNYVYMSIEMQFVLNCF